MCVCLYLEEYCFQLDHIVRKYYYEMKINKLKHIYLIKEKGYIDITKIKNKLDMCLLYSIILIEFLIK